MKLEDIIKDSYEVEKAKETSERISNFMRDGLDRLEKAFKSKFVDIVHEMSADTGAKCNALELRDYSLGEECDNFLKEKLQHERKRREEYYAEVPKSRPSQSGDDENGTLMPPLAMVPKIVSFPEMKKLFAGLNAQKQIDMSEIFGIKSEDMPQVIDHFHKVRNNLSHDQGQLRNPESVFCLREFVGPRKIKISHGGEVEYLDLKNNLFGTMTLLGHMLGNLPYNNMPLPVTLWKYEITEELSDLPQELLTQMGFSYGWMRHHVWQKSKRKSIQKIGALHNSDFQVLEDIHKELDSDLRSYIDTRTQVLLEKFIRKGWDTSGSGMDNCEWTARMCVMRSVLGSYNEVYGIPKHHANLAKVLADGSDDKNDLLNAYNDYHAEKLVYDSMCLCIPKNATDDFIFKKVERWMRFDKVRRDSDYHKSLRILLDVFRKGGPIVTLTNIKSGFVYPFIHDLADKEIHNFSDEKGDFAQFLRDHQKNHTNEIPEWLGPNASLEVTHKLYDVCRHNLMNKIGESGIVYVEYHDTHLWPKEIVINLNEASPKFKEEIENEYKLRDPEKVGCKPYDAPFAYPVILESEVEERLKESAPKENPFGSVDESLRYSYGYYFRCIRKRICDKIEPQPDPRDLAMETICRKLIAKGEGKYSARWYAKIILRNASIAERESTIPIEIENVNGKIHLNSKKMKLACSREADRLVRKAAKKIRRRN